MFLAKKKIGLASGSPRRFELLSSIGFDCVVYSPDILEQRKPEETILEYIARNSKEKNKAAEGYFAEKSIPIIISADTIVCIKNPSGAHELLEKPAGPSEAKKMLQMLSGRAHSVYTSYCVTNTQTSKHQQRTIETIVHFRNIGDDEIDSYVQTKEPYDKAGGYGAQGYGAVFVEKFCGSYTNVVGLPLTEVWQDWQQVNNPC